MFRLLTHMTSETPIPCIYVQRSLNLNLLAGYNNSKLFPFTFRRYRKVVVVPGRGELMKHFGILTSSRAKLDEKFGKRVIYYIIYKFKVENKIKREYCVTVFYPVRGCYININIVFYKNIN